MIKFFKQLFCNHDVNVNIFTDDPELKEVNSLTFFCEKCKKTIYKWKYVGDNYLIVKIEYKND